MIYETSEQLLVFTLVKLVSRAANMAASLTVGHQWTGDLNYNREYN